MKRIFSVLAALAMAAAFFGSALTVSAAGSEKTTPSGIAYDQIGSRVDSFIREREAGLASCEVSVFDGEGVIYNGYYGYADIENNIKADDYITKPFEPLEVAAKVRAQLRRVNASAVQYNSRSTITVGDMNLHLDECTFEHNGEVTGLTKAEFKVLELLMSQPKRVYTKEQIYESAWYDSGAVDDNTIHVIISRLRDKVGASHIKTIRGIVLKNKKQQSGMARLGRKTVVWFLVITVIAGTVSNLLEVIFDSFAPDFIEKDNHLLLALMALFIAAEIGIYVASGIVFFLLTKKNIRKESERQMQEKDLLYAAIAHDLGAGICKGTL